MVRGAGPDAGRSTYPETLDWQQTLNESLVLLPTGGAYASFGPSGVSSPAAQHPLYDAFYESSRAGRA